MIDATRTSALALTGMNEIYNFKNTPFQSAFVAVVNARKTLEPDLPACATPRSPPFLAVDLRNSSMKD